MDFGKCSKSVKEDCNCCPLFSSFSLCFSLLLSFAWLVLMIQNKKEVQLLMDSYRAIWAKFGCTIMGDGWADNRQRTLVNFLVYCPEGISFVKS